MNQHEKDVWSRRDVARSMQLFVTDISSPSYALCRDEIRGAMLVPPTFLRGPYRWTVSPNQSQETPIAWIGVRTNLLLSRVLLLFVSRFVLIFPSSPSSMAERWWTIGSRRAAIIHLLHEDGAWNCWWWCCIRARHPQTSTRRIGVAGVSSSKRRPRFARSPSSKASWGRGGSSWVDGLYSTSNSFTLLVLPPARSCGVTEDGQIPAQGGAAVWKGGFDDGENAENVPFVLISWCFRKRIQDRLQRFREHDRKITSGERTVKVVVRGFGASLVSPRIAPVCTSWIQCPQYQGASREGVPNMPDKETIPRLGGCAACLRRWFRAYRPVPTNKFDHNFRIPSDVRERLLT
ncbi:hypothetical protein BS47DRAFT_1464209 [Hydnum rufescens UP504]|uniref:Uncharacterized protein n=1 Tax=Hydnum rufescens UP504 TaxID=1448309 RepID=A0A9P6DW90_9AGAM|nr:hypothetical protein BS47DRAFT_1464209 [Hydnum rufescens UP504]